MNISPYISYCVLKPDTLLAEVETVCKEALRLGFAAVCVPPLFVKKAKGLLQDSKVKVATVIGFPFGYSAIESKVAEMVLSIIDGADELEMVVNISAIKNNDWNFIANEINTILPIAKNKDKVFKVIVESGILTNDEIVKCCDIYGAAGVDYIKTSTGYAEKGVSEKTLSFIRTHLSDLIKTEASGDVNSLSFAKELINVGADRISVFWGLEGNLEFRD